MPLLQNRPARRGHRPDKRHFESLAANSSPSLVVDRSPSRIACTTLTRNSSEHRGRTFEQKNFTKSQAQKVLEEAKYQVSVRQFVGICAVVVTQEKNRVISPKRSRLHYTTFEANRPTTCKEHTDRPINADKSKTVRRRSEP